MWLIPPSGTSRNPLDLRKECYRPNGLCYSEFSDLFLWMNSTEVKHELGIDPAFGSASAPRTFYENGLIMYNSAALIPELIKNGIRVLAYAGDSGGDEVH